ncbi:MAG: hypothetical protein RL563_23, partial [Pseudomonadota bacterium]
RRSGKTIGVLCMVDGEELFIINHAQGGYQLSLPTASLVTEHRDYLHRHLRHHSPDYLANVA